MSYRQETVGGYFLLAHFVNSLSDPTEMLQLSRLADREKPYSNVIPSIFRPTL